MRRLADSIPKTLVASRYLAAEELIRERDNMRLLQSVGMATDTDRSAVVYADRRYSEYTREWRSWGL